MRSTIKTFSPWATGRLAYPLTVQFVIYIFGIVNISTFDIRLSPHQKVVTVMSYLHFKMAAMSIFDMRRV